MIRSLAANLRREEGTRGLASWWALIAGVLHSALFAAALPPVGLWGLSFIAVVPLIAAAECRWAHRRRAALAMYAGCLAFWLFEQWWTWSISVAGYPPMCLYLTLYPLLFFVAYGRVRTRWAKVPAWVIGSVLWVGLEVLRGEIVWHGYAWGLVAHPLIESRWLSAPAAILGTYFVSWLVVVVAGLIVDTMAERGLIARAAGLAVAAAGWGVSALFALTDAMPSMMEKPVVVGVVQTNLKQSNKIAPTFQTEMDLWGSLREISEKAGADGAEIIIWPETMKPGMTLDVESVAAEQRAGVGYRWRQPDGTVQEVPGTYFVDELMALQRRVGVPIVVGEDAFDGLKFTSEAKGLRVDYDRRYNSVFVVEDGRVEPVRYDKVHLTPFGEQMPYIGAWPWLKDRLLALAAQSMKLDLAEGQGPVVLTARLKDGRDIRFVTPICFEVTDTRLVRRMVAKSGKRQAGLIVNLTNDGWFGASNMTREQHLQIARWRARELGTPVVRAANTGISAVIDAEGRLIPKTGDVSSVVARAQDEGRLLRSVRPAMDLTIYAAVGDVFPWTVLGAAVVWTGATMVRRKKPAAA